jgi:hypothetical protein
VEEMEGCGCKTPCVSPQIRRPSDDGLAWGAREREASLGALEASMEDEPASQGKPPNTRPRSIPMQAGRAWESRRGVSAKGWHR